MTKMAPTQIHVRCNDLDATVAMYTQQFGMQLDMIMPADAPRIAIVSADGVSVRIESAVAVADRVYVDTSSPSNRQLLLCRNGEHEVWIQGRAGMHYRDLIPGRLDGRFIASHIRIAEGGPVSDYVHYHNIAFQIIYCRRGWVRVVYEDQGPPFVMHAGDCVLQPPTIRHRVLESSTGLEVIEIGAPAEHETWREHRFDLPTPKFQPERFFAGQQFVHHVAANAQWQALANSGFEYRDTEIARVTGGIGSVRIFRCIVPSANASAPARMPIDDGEFVFLYVLDGYLNLSSEATGTQALSVDDACVIASAADFFMSATSPCTVLQVALPGR